MLAAKQAEHPVAHHLRALAGGDHQLQAEQVGVMNVCLGTDAGDLRICDVLCLLVPVHAVLALLLDRYDTGMPRRMASLRRQQLTHARLPRIDSLAGGLQLPVRWFRAARPAMNHNTPVAAK